MLKIRFAAAWMLLATCLLGLDAVQAGLTSSEVVVAVNGDSQNSRTLANHFVALRSIPARNVIVLSQVPDSETISVEDFRTKILRPILNELGRRKLSNHVQCIAYSADFPSAVNISQDLKQLKEVPQVYTPVGSINGLTYLYSQVLTGSPSYLGGVFAGLANDQNAALTSNYFVRGKLDTYFTNPGGQTTQARWDSAQELSKAGEHAKASEAYETLLKEHPHQFPLAYLAATEAAQAEDTKRANRLLELAIGKGWTAGGYLKRDKRFDAIRDDPEFQVLEFLVDESIVEYKTGVGFDARTSWTPNGIAVRGENAPKLGFRYLLSTVLGVTRGQGNSIDEAIAMLKSSTSADFSHPDGGFYFCLTKDVRTTTRQWGFIQATDRLKKMGYEAEIVTSALPMNKTKVLGAQTGVATYDWKSSNSTFLPGALADNLTSYGGVMTSPSQTKMTEFLKYGAAGSSGTVTEPYAIQEKFPLPQMYLHYANGASLAEAFYLSVAGPYQLLVIGDPLCRPFSNAPQQSLGEDLRYLPQDTTLNLQIDLSGPVYADWQDDSRKQKLRTEPFAPNAISILFDGTNPVSRPVRPNLNLRLTNQPPGYHELVLRFASADPLRQKNESLLPIWLGDKNSITILAAESTNGQGTRKSPLPFSLSQKTLQLQGKAPNAKRLTLLHDWEQLASVAGTQHVFNIDASSLGLGPSRIQLRAELENGQQIESRPLWINVSP